MSTRPTLALMIPAYNAAAFLPRLLKSAAEQTEPFDAIWVYDDCSTDNSVEVARAHGAQVLSGDVNRGCSAGKNRLAQHVDADWIHFHDADDDLLPNFVGLARKWIMDGRFDVVLFDYEYRDGATNELLLERHFDHETLVKDPKSLAIREQINPFCGLYRRSAYLAAGGYEEDPAVLYNEDVAFHIRLAFAGLSFAAENEVSIINFRYSNSMSSGNALRCLQAHFEVMRKTLARPGAHRYQKKIGERLWHVAGGLRAYGDRKSAEAAAQLANTLCSPPKSSGSAIFRALARVSPAAALHFRERWIRTMKPAQRVNLGYGQA